MSAPLPGRTLPFAPSAFRALGHREFRLLWLGQVVSLTGSWMQSLAQGWLVLRLTDSAFFLGLVGFMAYLPTLLFALPAGVAADRLPRRTALLWTQAGALVLAIVLATLTWSELIRTWQVALLAFGLGLVGTLDIPVRQALLLDLVGRDDLPNAIALNSLAFNLARFVGPPIAGLLVARIGEAPVFLINAVSFSAVLAGVAMIRPRPAPDRDRKSWASEIRGGLRHALLEPRMRALLGLAVASSIFAMPYSILLPLFARDILGVGSNGLGYMMGAAGVGAMAGALLLAAWRGRPEAYGRISVAVGLLGLGLIAFSRTRELWVACALLFLIGAAIIVQLASSNTMLQLLSPPELRGRIISLYLLAFMGMAPIGSLLAGLVAREWGAPNTVGIGGVACVLAAVGFAVRTRTLARAAAPSAAGR